MTASERAALTAERDAARAEMDTLIAEYCTERLRDSRHITELEVDRDAARADCRNLRSLVEQAISCLRMGRYTQMADELRAGLRRARPDLERAVLEAAMKVARNEDGSMWDFEDACERYRAAAATASPGVGADGEARDELDTDA